MRKMLWLLPLALITTACTDTGGFTSRVSAWETAFNAQDVEAIVEMYNTDARLMPPNLPIMTGHDAVREMFGGMIEAGITVELETSSFEVALNTAHRTGTFKTLLNGEVVDTGKFIETWNKDEGAWRMSNDIWNSDNPPPQSASDQGEHHKGMEHPHLIIVHEVEDGERWLDAWRGDDSRHVLFESNGAKHVHTFQHPDKPNLTGLVVAVEDMDALTAMLSSEDGQAAATEDGVDLENMKVLPEVK